MTRKKHLWIPLTLMLLASIAMVDVPVKAVSYNLTVESTPIGGIDFTIDASAYTTNTTVALEEGNYNVTMPATWSVGTDHYKFVEWEDSSTDLVRNVSLTSDTTIITTYEPTVKIYVVPEPPAFVPGVVPPDFVYVDVYIDSPSEWYNDNETGIVGWAMSIKVDPDVLEPWSINGSTAGFFLYDFTDGEYGELTTLLLTKDGPNGLFYEVSEFIDGWESDPFYGAGAGGNAKLFTLKYKSHSSWYSLIDLGYPASVDIDTVYYYTATGKFAAGIIGDGQYSGLPTYEANMVRRSAWPEHHHFVRSKDGWANVTDSHGTPGNLTLYARIRNDGDVNVTVRAEFNLTFGLAEYPLNPIVTDEAEIEIGQIIDLTATFQGLDGEFPWEAEDDGKWRVEAFCRYYDANTETWEIGTRKTKTFGIAVVA